MTVFRGGKERKRMNKIMGEKGSKWISLEWGFFSRDSTIQIKYTGKCMDTAQSHTYIHAQS